MIENLEIIQTPRFLNNEMTNEKGISFIFNGFHFAFFADEAKFLKFFPNSSNCKVQYRAVCFTLSNNDATSLQKKIQELKE